MAQVSSGRVPDVVSFLDLSSRSHRRFNPITREWILVSPHRTDRPWQGQMESPVSQASPPFDPSCYLCPGNARAGGSINPAYSEVFVFDNDFPALLPTEGVEDFREGNLLLASSEFGRCRVVCFSPRHDLTMARMSIDQLRPVINAWIQEYVELGGDPKILSVQIFENRGSAMGCSNSHPHGQVWANGSIPNELAKELASFDAYFRSHGAPLLSDYLQLELSKKERVICANDYFVGLVPFWAVWPFETIVLSRRQVSGLDELSEEERTGLADILRQVTIRYDNLFKVTFPYTMGIHQRPTDGRRHSGFSMHIHFYPPLLRSASIKKFMVGYEMLAMPQRDITPEAAAAWLRDLPANHYLAGES
jgi:UDPglucose--hexose-1-phosphate uridylyltransferase